MKSWIKGGLVGVFVGILILIIYLLMGSLLPRTIGIVRIGQTNIFGIINHIFLILMFPISIFYLMGLSQNIFGSIIYISVSYFLIGAFIGWLVGKIRKR